MEVLVFGSLNIDLICYVNRLPKPGETLNGSRFCSGFGGKGANQCVAAAKLGAKTAIIGKVGDDIWGKEFLAELRKLNVDTENVDTIQNETTGMAQITVSDDGENTIVIVLAANNRLSADDVVKAKSLFESSKILICQLESSTAAVIAALRNFKGISILNAAPALANMPKELFTLPTILCVNETEAALITDLPNVDSLDSAKTALKRLLAKDANTVILTMGSMGAVYVRREEPNIYVHVSSPQTKAVDTTGAGDAFIGALAYFMARYPNAEFHQYVGAACKVAAQSVTRCGTQKSFPNAEEIEFRFGEQPFIWQQL